jgi:hypothetical protein
MHEIQYAYRDSKYFETQGQMAEWLGISNSSKKAIISRCNVNGYGVRFKGEHEQSRKYGYQNTKA